MSSHSFQLFVDACGRAVQADIQAFKESYFQSLNGQVVTCPHTGTALTLENSAAELTGQSLEALVRKFVTRQRVDEIMHYGLNAANMLTLTDAELVARWKHYFWKHATMRLVLDTDAVLYEPSDQALQERAMIRQQMIADGWLFKGNPVR